MDELILDLYSMLVVGIVCAGLLLSLGALWRYLHRSLSASSSSRKPPLRTPHPPLRRPPMAILGALAGAGAVPASNHPRVRCSPSLAEREERCVPMPSRKV